MAWADVEWSNLDVPTRDKGQQMDDNLDYVREVIRWRTLAQNAGVAEIVEGQYFFNWQLQLRVGTLSWNSATITAASWAEVTGLRNKDASALTDGGVYVLQAVAVSTTFAGHEELLASTRFRKTPDCDHLSVFAEGVGDTSPSLRGYTVLGTRDNEGF
jgi:hypothetical protein